MSNSSHHPAPAAETGSFFQRWFYRNKQWLYRGRRPNRWAKLANRIYAILGAKTRLVNGVLFNGLVTLDVVGRKSGKIVSFPLVMLTLDRQRYLASMLGAEAQWVRNVRAADGHAVLRTGGTREEVCLEEVPIDQRPPLMKAYLQAAPGARPHVPVDKDAPLADFEKIAADYPVFRLNSGQLQTEAF